MDVVVKKFGGSFFSNKKEIEKLSKHLAKENETKKIIIVVYMYKPHRTLPHDRFVSLF